MIEKFKEFCLESIQEECYQKRGTSDDELHYNYNYNSYESD